MKKKLVAALLCLALALALLPAPAQAAGEFVRINGASLTANTPYYFQNPGTADSDPHGGAWNAWLELAGGSATLHLKDLQLPNCDLNGIYTEIAALTIDVAGDNSLQQSDFGEVDALVCKQLAITGNGSLRLAGRANSADYADTSLNGFGIRSNGGITIDHGVLLTVSGGLGAATPLPAFPTGTLLRDFNVYANTIPSATGAVAINDVADYTPDKRYYAFTPWFFITVGTTQVTFANRKNVLGDGTVVYTPAQGGAAAELWLNGVNLVDVHHNSSANRTAGISANTGPLTIRISGNNSISTTSSSTPNLCGIFAAGALTIIGDADATLSVNAVNLNTTASSLAYGIAGSSIAVSGGSGDASASAFGPQTAFSVAPVFSGGPALTSGSWDGVDVTWSTAVAFSGLAAKDGTDTASTTALTLQFSRDIAGLAIDDITVTGATKGALSKESAAGQYTLSISNITVGDNGTVTVAVNNSGVILTPASRSASVRVYTPPAPLSFADSAAYDVPSGQVGESYTASTAFTAAGGAAPYVFSVDPAVSGLSINGENKLVFTRPSVQAATTATIKVTDAANATATISIDVGAVTALPPPDAPDVVISPLPNFPEGGANRDRTVTIGAGIVDFIARSNFDGAKIDGHNLDLGTVNGSGGADGSVRDGSIVIVLNTAYLNTLREGTHTLSVQLKGGIYAGMTVTATITVTPAAVVPTTGDNTLVWAGAVLALLCGAGIATSALMRRRKRG